jgi:hypothetical protein
LETWKLIASQIANGNLTLSEWHEYFPDRPYHATFNNIGVPPDEEPNNPTDAKRTTR